MSEPVEPSQQNEEVLIEQEEMVEAPSFPVLTEEVAGELTAVNMDMAQLRRIFEAALLTTQEPLSPSELKRLSGVALETRQVEVLMQELGEKYADSGIELTRVSSGWRFRARPEMQEFLDRLDPQRPPRYSRAVMETLAIIAYRQPVTRGDIEDIRGVAVSSQILKTLEGRSWIESIGTRDTPGKPALYATTQQLLDDLNLRSLSDLPALEEMGSLIDQSNDSRD
jgi:segregation and condensation protein B